MMNLPHILPNGRLLDLAVIAASGQAFRMRPLGDAWTLVQGETVIVLRQQDGEVRYATWPEGATILVERLFRCDVVEKELEKELGVDPYVAEAARVWLGSTGSVWKRPGASFLPFPGRNNSRELRMTICAVVRSVIEARLSLMRCGF